ncbi:MAG: hypothetical protein HY553_10775 [Elusimicrobia bacterium]|nr:hypothetical protein [Elusimicrobiota bacterium]
MGPLPLAIAWVSSALAASLDSGLLIMPIGPGTRSDAAFVAENVSEACRQAGLAEILAGLASGKEGRSWRAADVERNVDLLAPELERWREGPPGGDPELTYCLAHRIPEIVLWPFDDSRPERTLLGFRYSHESEEGGGRGGYVLELRGDKRPGAMARWLAGELAGTRWGEAAFLEALLKSRHYEEVIVNAEDFLDRRPHSSIEAELHRELAIAYSSWWSLLNTPADSPEWEFFDVPDPKDFKSEKGRFAKHAEGVRRLSLRHLRRALELRPLWRPRFDRELRALEEGRDTERRSYVPTQC